MSATAAKAKKVTPVEDKLRALYDLQKIDSTIDKIKISTSDYFSVLL